MENKGKKNGSLLYKESGLSGSLEFFLPLTYESVKQTTFKSGWLHKSV